MRIPTRRSISLMGAKGWKWLDELIVEWLMSEPYTDGACTSLGSRWARAVYGVFYYDKCP